MPGFAEHIKDTLPCDTLLLRQLQESPEYDYHREFHQRDDSIIKKIMDWIEDLFDQSVNTSMQGDMKAIWGIVAIVVLMAMFYYLYANKVGLFKRLGKSDLEYDVEDEDIYSIDFDTRISTAVEQCNWREAARLTHLKTLRLLADKGRIEWAHYKTPTQYTTEERSVEFRDMTNEFLRVRYGHYDADEETYRQMHTLSQSLINRIEEELTTTHQPEGGEA